MSEHDVALLWSVCALASGYSVRDVRFCLARACWGRALALRVVPGGQA